MATSEAQTLLVRATGLEEGSRVEDLLADVARAITSLAGNWENGQVAVQLKELNSVTQVQAEAVTENTQAVLQDTVAHATSGRSTLSSVGSAVWKVFRSGLGLSPVVSALVGLFGGSNQEAPAPLPVYTRPPAIQFEGTLGGAAAPAGPRAPEPPTGRESQGPQITIQVQAMDSRSFLDHSDEIARAVREAMLNSHSLNDVVSELS